MTEPVRWSSVAAVSAPARSSGFRSLLRLAAALSLLAGCGEPCASLSKALCDGGEDAYCAQVDGWLNSRLIDPQTKEPLQGAARTQVCTAIHGSVDIFNAYRFKAKQKLLGEPDFTVASSTPAANKADPTPPAKADGKAVTTITTPPMKVDLTKADDEAKDDARPDESIKPDEKPGDGEEDKPAANMSD